MKNTQYNLHGPLKIVELIDKHAFYLQFFYSYFCQKLMIVNYRYTITIVLVVLCFVQGAGQEINKTDSEGRKQGLWMKYYDDNDSLLRYKGRFVDDLPVDTFIYLYPTGELQTTLFHRKDGYAISNSYHKEGTLMATGRYYNQKKDSTWNYYNELGIRISLEFFIEGKKYNSWKVFYPDGKLAALKNWENDMENGPHMQYYRNETLFKELNFVNGSLEGPGVYYHENGQVSRKGEYYHDAKEGIWKEYDEEGNLVREIKYNRGVPEGGLPIVQPASEDERYQKDRLDEYDFLEQGEYAPVEEKKSRKKK